MQFRRRVVAAIATTGLKVVRAVKSPAGRSAGPRLSELGSKKPGLVGKIINNASEKAGRCFEILSGAELTEKEIGAKNGKAFNSECPWLWSGNTVTK